MAAKVEKSSLGARRQYSRCEWKSSSEGMKSCSTRSLLAAVLLDVSALACLHAQLCPHMVVTQSKRSEHAGAKTLTLSALSPSQ